MDIGSTTMVGTLCVILYLNHPRSRNQATVTLPDTYVIDLQQLISWTCGIHHLRVVAMVTMVVVDCQ